MDFIGKYWRGAYPLSVSFWLVFVSLGAVYHYMEPFLQRPLADRPAVYIWTTIIYLVVCRLFIFPWQVVGLLRASDRHYLTYQRPAVKSSVQATIVLSLAFTAAHIIGAVQSLVAYKEKIEFQAVRGTPEYSLELVAGGRLLQLQGVLDFGVVEAVKTILDGNPRIQGVVLDSEGGQIYEGRGLGMLIDQHELDTYTFVGCSSACSTAFIGGRKRYLGTNAKLGFHRYRLDSSNIPQFYKFYDLGIEEKKDLDAFKAKNLKDEFLRKVFQTPHDQMWFPDTQTLIDARVIDGTVDKRRILESYTALGESDPSTSN
jgi:hypothetical protein